MAFIVEQFVGDRGIQIGVEDVIRPFSFGTNWSKIRVGIHFAINGTGNTAANIGPRLGVCTGNNAYLSNTTTDALWLNTFFDGTGLTLSGTAPNLYLLCAGATSFSTEQRVGSTTYSTTNAILTSPQAYSANPTQNRSMATLTLTKGTIGAAAFTQQATYMTAAQAVADISRSTFLAQMENETGTLAGVTNTTAGSNNITASGRWLKDWDSMFVNFGRSTPTLTVFEMCVVRFA